MNKRDTKTSEKMGSARKLRSNYDPVLINDLDLQPFGSDAQNQYVPSIRTISDE